jgi:hypothetical protein
VSGETEQDMMEVVWMYGAWHLGKVKRERLADDQVRFITLS